MSLHYETLICIFIYLKCQIYNEFVESDEVVVKPSPVFPGQCQVVAKKVISIHVSVITPSIHATSRGIRECELKSSIPITTTTTRAVVLSYKRNAYQCKNLLSDFIRDVIDLLKGTNADKSAGNSQ